MINNSMAIRNELWPKNAERFFKRINPIANTSKGGNNVVIPQRLTESGRTMTIRNMIRIMFAVCNFQHCDLWVINIIQKLRDVIVYFFVSIRGAKQTENKRNKLIQSERERESESERERDRDDKFLSYTHKCVFVLFSCSMTPKSILF